MSKFKVGDCVRIICDKNTPSRRKIGDSFVIGELAGGAGGRYVIFPDDRNPDGHGFHDNQLEFEQVYNSPLYKALE